MNVSVPKTQFARIGSKGLDILHITRLKVACSLLMAEYIRADLQEWEQQSIDLLVASTDDADGRRAMDEARKRQVPIISITRQGASSAATSDLRHGASVQDIFQHLRQILHTADAGGNGFKPGTLFRGLEMAAGKACLLRLGPVKLFVDEARQRIAVIYGSWEDCLDAAAESGWRLTTETNAGDKAAGLDDGISRHAFEDFCWQAAALASAPLAAPAADGSYALRSWPEVASDHLPPQWLLPMNAMLIRSWKPLELAQATDTPLAEIHRMMAAAACTALLEKASASTVKSRTTRASVSSFFSRIASRFGLHFNTNTGN